MKPTRILLLCSALTLAGSGCDDGPAAPETTRDGGAQGADAAMVTTGSAATDGGAQGADAAMAATGSTAKGGGGAVTYYQHVKPVMDAKCVRCHADGTVAPFALDTYELATKWAKPSVAAVTAGRMPPWKFDADCNEYVGDFSLSAAEKKLLNDWVEQGTQAGDEKAPSAKIDLGETKLSRVDVTLELPEPYVPQKQPDEYRCFPVPWEKTKTAFMTGFRAVPGNPKIVHHIEVYHVPADQVPTVQQLDGADPGPGYECFSGPGTGSGTIGGWAPGSPGYDYPDGVGIQIEPGAVIVVQVHYNRGEAQPEPDRSRVELKVDDSAVRGGYNFWTNPAWTTGGMPIPADNPDVKFTWTAPPTVLSAGQPMLLYTAGLHMHQLGKTGYMKLKRQDGSTVCMLQISDWDFHWQGGVRFREPIAVNAGDTIEMQCGFDNSAPKQGLDPKGDRRKPIDVNWGENTSDEMCLGVLLWGPQR